MPESWRSGHCERRTVRSFWGWRSGILDDRRPKRRLFISSGSVIAGFPRVFARFRAVSIGAGQGGRRWRRADRRADRRPRNAIVTRQARTWSSRWRTSDEPRRPVHPSARFPAVNDVGPVHSQRGAEASTVGSSGSTWSSSAASGGAIIVTGRSSGPTSSRSRQSVGGCEGGGSARRRGGWIRACSGRERGRISAARLIGARRVRKSRTASSSTSSTRAIAGTSYPSDCKMRT